MRVYRFFGSSIVNIVYFCIASLSITAYANENVCIEKFELYRQEKIDAGVAEKHLPRLMLVAGNHSKKTVILIHGLFESPYFIQGVANQFSLDGYNVLSILLPGHWEQDPHTIDRITYQDWLDEMDRGVKIAECFGPHILFAGHSLGGILAMTGVLRYPRQAIGLAMWAPAFQLKALPTLGGVLASMTGLSGNTFIGTEPDSDEVAKISGNAAIQIYDLIQYVGRTFGTDMSLYNGHNRRDLPLSYLDVYSRITVPTFVVIPENDPAVSWKESLTMFSQLSGPKELILYPRRSSVGHANVAKSKIDTYRSDPNGFNHEFDEMMATISQFFRDNLNHGKVTNTDNKPTREGM